MKQGGEPERPSEHEREPSITSAEAQPSKPERVPHAILDWVAVYRDNFSLVQSTSMDADLRLVAYTRLSQSNAHENESHEAQYERIQEWTTKNGHHLVAHHRETISGLVERDSQRRAIEDLDNHLEQRIALADTLNDLETGEADGVVVDVQDRLSRDPVVVELVLRDVWRTGKGAFSVLQGDLLDDPEDPTQEMMRTIVGAVDRYAGRMTKLRMARGRRRAIQNGRLIGPAPSFGWRKDPDDPGLPVPDPETFPLVEEAMERRRAGASLREVGAYLEAETGRSWSPTQVKRVCERYERYGAT